MRLFEIIKPKQKFYHGSEHNLPRGTILLPADERNELKPMTPVVSYLEAHRPASMLGHENGVFMTDNIPLIADIVGGSFIFTVKPLGPVQRHDINWISYLNTIMDDTPDNTSELQKAAEGYWNGSPCHLADEPVWEYITTHARIIRDNQQIWWDEKDGKTNGTRENW